MTHYAVGPGRNHTGFSERQEGESERDVRMLQAPEGGGKGHEPRNTDRLGEARTRFFSNASGRSQPCPHAELAPKTDLQNRQIVDVFEASQLGVTCYCRRGTLGQLPRPDGRPSHGTWSTWLLGREPCQVRFWKVSSSHESQRALPHPRATWLPRGWVPEQREAPPTHSAPLSAG